MRDYAAVAFMRGALNLRRARSSIFANFPSPIGDLPSIRACQFSLATVLRTNGSRSCAPPTLVGRIHKKVRQSVTSRNALPETGLFSLLERLLWQRLVRIRRRDRRSGVLYRHFLGSGRQARSKLRISVFRGTHISLHAVSVNSVDDHLHGLRIAHAMDPDRFVEIYFLLVEFIVVHDHGQVEALVLGVRFP